MQEELKALEEASRKQALYEFMDLCPTEEHEAEFYLDEARYDVEVLIRNYSGRRPKLPRRPQESSEETDGGRQPSSHPTDYA